MSIPNMVLFVLALLATLEMAVRWSHRQLSWRDPLCGGAGTLMLTEQLEEPAVRRQIDSGLSLARKS
ncbi:hypothetical protein [Methylobacterium sp. PvR107]|uniref:hypothetical protein n=1 Tax=Methylobacterium sp. PvR107 TaxID=2806597 RepID=UPI001AE96F3F|nr:hypothetical protein [Methylobacterium sp. PvR107]MBP1178182.1 hypothetical protein [Methylobacterium sp. PvR107]